MPVFSDSTIRARLTELVKGGTSDDARHCAYEFTAATLFKGAAAGPEPIDANHPIVIEPKELVWIKAREQVHVPEDVVGLWLQTQTLSRMGLLLLNTTLIEPGYSGPLHAVFVNFGQRRVTIDATTKIAKVVFFELDRKAESLVRMDVSGYDRAILDVSSNAPGSFLSIESLVSDLATETAARKEDLRREAEAVQAQLAAVLEKDLKDKADAHKDALREEREKQKDVMEQGARSVAIRWFGGALVGFLAGVAAVWLGISVYMPKLTASYAELDTLAKNAIQVRADACDKAAADVRTSRTDIDQLQKDILLLKAQNDAMEKRLGGQKP